MSGPASTAVGAYNKVNDWMSGMSGLVDEIMRPLVEPLADQLEFVTGDPETLKEAAKLWRDKAADLRDIVADQRRDRADLAHEWTGEAAEALQGYLAELETAMEAEADDMDKTADVLEGAAEQAQFAQEMVEAIIQELIEWALITLAAALALTVVTAGLSWAGEAAMAATEASVATSRIAEVVYKLGSNLKSLSNILKLLKRAKKLTKLSRVKKIKPWTWKHMSDPVEREAFLMGQGAKKALKAIKTPLKAGAAIGMGGLGFSGTPLGAAAGVAVDHAAEEIDEFLTGDKSSSSGDNSSPLPGLGSPRPAHSEVHLPPAPGFVPSSDVQEPVSPLPGGRPTAPDPGFASLPDQPVAQDPLSRYREPAVAENPGVTTMPAAARTTAPRDPDNPFG
ncbi:WXG100 family type VII secretion target [Streptomyces decoyicus]|uniref:WXG100 family type VII secretion target n=1 Tax=Streptomyces decoyicus TaxID=249567 RepID=UPI003645FD2E